VDDPDKPLYPLPAGDRGTKPLERLTRLVLSEKPSFYADVLRGVPSRISFETMRHLDR